MTYVLRALRWFVPACTAALVAATSTGCDEEAPPAADACADIAIDPFKEIMIVDESVLGSERSKNATNGPWSFRYAIENMKPADMPADDFVRGWLLSWGEQLTFNGFPLDKRDEHRGVEMQKRVICPWLRMTPENQCDAACTTCAEQKLDMAKAPFRPIAIVNRLHLRNDGIELSPGGEGRIVFALTQRAQVVSAEAAQDPALKEAAPGDDPNSYPMPAALIFEYALPPTKTTKEWAEAWHALGSFASYDEPYLEALAQLTDGFVKRDAWPGRPNGSALAQIRTNESALNWIWQLREFGLAPDGVLRHRALFNTPDDSFNKSPALVQFLNDNAEAVLKNRHRIPARMQSGSAENVDYSWGAPGVDPLVRRAFAAETCNGCHGLEHPIVDTTFHISPFKKGLAKLSPFVFDPSGLREDHLTVRVRDMRDALCGR